MAEPMKFIPQKQSDVLIYAGQVNTVLTAVGFVPGSLGLTTGDVTELGACLNTAQAAADYTNSVDGALQQP